MSLRARLTMASAAAVAVAIALASIAAYVVVRSQLVKQVDQSLQQSAQDVHVDFQQTFSGTVIQNLVSDKDPIKLGDTVRVNSQLN